MDRGRTLRSAPWIDVFNQLVKSDLVFYLHLENLSR
jgi:hypothetical protein